MKVSGYIARRYFFSRQNKNAVNIITAISLLGLLVGAAALIIVLSAMNGLEGLVRSNYNTFDPDLKVSPEEGKFFEDSPTLLNNLMQLEGVSAVSRVLEERAILNFRDKEHIVSLKGVDTLFSQVSHIEDAMLHGKYALNHQRGRSIIIGTGVGYYLGYSRIDLGESISAFVLQSNASAANFSNAFNTLNLQASGIFSIQADFDANLCLINLAYLQDAVKRKGKLTNLEIGLVEGAKVEEVQAAVEQVLGNAYKVENRDEQQAVFYKVMKSEGLFAYLIFALILSIATFTIMGSLAMLMLDKKRDLRTLWALGLPIGKLQDIFFNLGMLIGGGGALIGLLLGMGLVLIQQYSGLIKVGEGYLVEYYPVALEWSDVLLVTVTVLSLSSVTAYVSARRLGVKLLRSN